MRCSLSDIYIYTSMYNLFTLIEHINLTQHRKAYLIRW